MTDAGSGVLVIGLSKIRLTPSRRIPTPHFTQG